MSARVGIWGPPGLPEVREGDDLASLIAAAVSGSVSGSAPAVSDSQGAGSPHQSAAGPAGAAIRDGDVIVVTSKIVSKAEGRVLVADDREKAIDAETVRVVARRAHARGETRIVETRHGLILAAAGVDASNTAAGTVLLLPEDPDASARRLRAEIGSAAGARIGVVIADSFGRAWRIGQAEVAIGCTGLVPIDDWRGRHDANGRELMATQIAIADEAASAADLVRDKAAAVPAVVLGGLGRWVTEEDGPGAAAIRRPREDDLFR
jgi:coenzyme F420-0:L-glutamate ligase/coenzyme F420-1:gamma-L-glutamate ligase